MQLSKTTITPVTLQATNHQAWAILHELYTTAGNHYTTTGTIIIFN